MFMKKLVLILGNGFTIDLLSHLRNGIPEGIDLINLFSKGDTVVWPGEKLERGFLSYKYCPALWSLGARPNMDKSEANELMENILTCANMMSSANTKPQNNNVYLDAYYELAAYLRYLFVQYNDTVSDDLLKDVVEEDWGWLKLIKGAYESNLYERIIIITYNYDIFLERLLRIKGIKYDIGGIEENNNKVILLKPHGSISFVHNYKGVAVPFRIRKNDTMNEANISDFDVTYDNLSKNYLVSALIPPAGDSNRLAYGWAKGIRSKIDSMLEAISDGDQCVISGISYWHVDRQEIDKLLAKVSKKQVDTYMVNPHPPKALSAVLACVLPNHITYSSSDWIGELIDE